MNNKLINIFNVISFYVVWWGCVIGVNLEHNYLGLLLTCLFVIFHLNIISNLNKEWKLLVACFALGSIVESIHLHSGILVYKGYILNNEIFPPSWIICMWIGFGGTLNYSMGWMKSSWILQFVMGAVFGPISYVAGVKLGVISFYYSFEITVFVLGVIWGLSIPVMYFLNDYFNKEEESLNGV